MPKIQVVVSQDMKILYLGYDRAKAKEVWVSALMKSVGEVEVEWYETDEDTEIDLKLGGEEEDETL